MLVQVYNSTPDEKLADTALDVSLDGVRRTVPAGEIIRLTPGESITITAAMSAEPLETGLRDINLKPVEVTDDTTVEELLHGYTDEEVAAAENGRCP